MARFLRLLRAASSDVVGDTDSVVSTLETVLSNHCCSMSIEIAQRLSVKAATAVEPDPLKQSRMMSPS